MNQFLSLLLCKFLSFCTSCTTSYRKTFIIGSLFLINISLAFAQPTLVKDINTSPAVIQNSPKELINVNNILYYTGTNLNNGTELWRSDGTPEGTYIVKDIVAGNASSNPEKLTNVNGTLYFIANYTIVFNTNNYQGTYELWKSDGTAASTVKVKDFTYGPIDKEGAGPFPIHLITVNNALFLTANSTSSTYSLFKSDGTTSGTIALKGFSHNGSGSAFSAINVNGTLYFSAETGPYGTELWKSNGTAAGTVMVKDIRQGYASSIPAAFANVNGTLYFSAENDINGRELWKSDGTEAGTVMVKDIVAGAAGSSPSKLVNVNGTLYFSADNSVNGEELWKSDGTAAGTVLVKDIYPGTSGRPNNSLPTILTNINGTLYFIADNGINGTELWKSNGTAAGTVMVKDINPGTATAFPYDVDGRVIKTQLVNINGTVYFGAYNSTNGMELWKSDGTDAGTVLVKDINPGSNSSSPAYLTNINGILFFTTYLPTTGSGLWKSDGTAAGTVEVFSNSVVNTDSSSPSNFTYVNSTLYFSANNGVNGRELWKSDGTNTGTVLVKDIVAGAAGSSPSNLVNVNGILYFSADNGTNGVELWKSDGTAAGTVMVKDIKAGTGSSGPDALTNVNGILYFVADDGINGKELWKSDGTAAGTVLVKDIYPGAQHGVYSSSYYTYTGAELFHINGVIYFMANNGTSGFELWKSNGTAAGTVMVKDINPGANSSNYHTSSYFTNVNGTLFFIANNGTNGVELWKSDGTAAGTTMVKDLTPGSDSSAPQNLTVLNGTLYFSCEYLDGYLFKSDGTAAGTVIAEQIGTLVSYGAGQKHIVSSGGKIYLATRSGTPEVNETFTLWVSDGTSASTVALKSGFKINSWDQPHYFTDINGILYFSANDGESGWKLWKSDGTAAGTTLVDGAISSGLYSPRYLTNVNSTLYFSGSSSKGHELWKYAPSAPSCTATGSILREYWANITGNYVTAIPVNTAPTSSSQVTSFEGPVNAAENYGARYRGYICAPATGSYTFYISGDDNSELYLSTDDQPATKTRIASVPGSTGVKVWNKYSTQKSAVISLQAGKRYYVEVLHKEGLGSDNLAVGWTVPGSSSIVVIPGSVLSPFVPAAITCSATGSILREYWANITGNYVTAIPVNTTPTSSSQVTSFQGPVNVAENYGARYRGYICAPATGIYTFYISGDDNSELFLSTDDQPTNKVKIASVPGSTGVKVWNKYSTQKSATISLQAGKKYYIEALHKEGLGGDNLAVGWMLPNTSAIAVISGSYLSPFVPTTPTGCTASGSILREYWSNITGNYVTAIPVNSTPTSSSQVTSFQGPVNVAENYGARYRGYICAPATGSYTFYISGDDNSELYLSTDDQPATKTRIASVPGSTGVKIWNKYSTQKSAVISLQADKKYYVEVLHKEGLGSDNLAVGWTVPGSSSIVVIPGSVLSPFVPTSNARLASEQTAEAIHTMSAYPNPFADKLTIALAGVEGKLTITLTDVVGREQLSTIKQVSREQQALELDFSSYQLKSGVYLLRLQAEDGKSKVIRVIKN